MTETLKVVSPADGNVVVERQKANAAQLDAALAKAAAAAPGWRKTPLAERIAMLGKLTDAVVSKSDLLADELTKQMGRPIGQTPGEIRGFEERSRGMLAIAEEALSDVVLPDKEGFTRFIRREPLGVVLVLAPWNYPWLTSVNAVLPALAAGNVVLLKHAAQTPLVAERFVEAGREAGLPEGVFEFVHLSHELTARAVADSRVGFVAFTGSVEGGHAIHRAAADRFIACGLELGGKDPAYVAPDCELDPTIAGLVDGSFFNSGQSCCGIERIYVHADVYDRFVEGFDKF